MTTKKDSAVFAEWLTNAPDKEKDAYGSFLGSALREYHTKYPKEPIPKLSLKERNSIRELLTKRGLHSLKRAFKSALQTGQISPDQKLRPFSVFVAELTGEKPSPHCVARCHIRKEHFGVYDFAAALSKAGTKYFWLSERVTAEWTCRSRSSARRAIDWLVEHGWLAEVQPRRKRRGWQYYMLTQHEDWILDRCGEGFGQNGERPCCTVQAEEDL